MPTYEYECTKGHIFEIQQSITEDPLKTCQKETKNKKCGASCKRLISATRFVLKGRGWYSDGYNSSASTSTSSNKTKWL